MNWTVTSTGNDFMVEDFKIKKGDKFLCISDVVMDGCSTDIAYKTGVIYESERDDCITDEQGWRGHLWEYNPTKGEIYNDKWTDYFQRHDQGEEYCGCRGKDYFDSMKEEYGKRSFESGAVRDSNEGKSRPDLISPYFTERLGFRLAEGAKKYAERNWERGIPDEAFLESLERHLVAYKMGKTDEDHAAAIAFNIMGIIHNEEVRKLK